MQSNLKAFRIALMLVLSLFFGTVSAQTVTGNVVDETGEAVIGATVMEKGTKNATVTDFDGNFTIKLESGNVLTISYIGMQSQDVNVAGKSSVNVILKEDATTLQDVVVVGYGTMKKQDLTGSALTFRSVVSHLSMVTRVLCMLSMVSSAQTSVSLIHKTSSAWIF